MLRHPSLRKVRIARAAISPRLAMRMVKGGGTLYTYTVARIPTLVDFADEMPQKLAVVELDEGDPADLAARYVALRSSLPGLRVLGGCCGTDHRHVAAIVAAWAAAAA